MSSDRKQDALDADLKQLKEQANTYTKAQVDKGEYYHSREGSSHPDQNSPRSGLRIWRPSHRSRLNERNCGKRSSSSLRNRPNPSKPIRSVDHWSCSTRS